MTFKALLKLLRKKGGEGGDIYQRFKQFQHFKNVILLATYSNVLHYEYYRCRTKNFQPILFTLSFSAIVTHQNMF